MGSSASGPLASDRVRKISSAFDVLLKRGGDLSVIGLVLLVGLVCANVIGRFAFNRPLFFADEVSTYLMAMVVFLGLGYTLVTGGHVEASLIVNRLKPEQRLKVKLITNFIGLIWSVALVIAGFSLWWYNVQGKVYSIGLLQAPLWLVTITFPVGSGLMLLGVVSEIMKAFRKPGGNRNA